MAEILVFLLFVGLVYVAAIMKKFRTPSNLRELPIEKGIPILGALSNYSQNTGLHCYELVKKYGPIFHIRVGFRKVVVLNSYRLLKLAFKDMGNNFSGRPRNKLVDLINRKCGILSIEGEKLGIQRAFLLRTLTNFLKTESHLNNVIEEECQKLIEQLNNKTGEQVDFSDIISLSTANILGQFIMSKTFRKGDSELDAITNFINKFVNKKDILQKIGLVFPFQRKSEILSKILLKIFPRKQHFDEIHKIFEREIKIHSDNLDFNSNGQDLIDEFLLEQRRQNSENGNHSFVDWQLVRAAFEMFVAGYDTTSKLLVWSMLLLARHVVVQENLYQEIIRKVGTGRLRDFIDKKNLEYAQAVLDEILRFSAIIPVGLSHRNFKDTEIDGYFIEKDSVISQNLYACNRDKQIWARPFEFYPEHFLEPNSTDILNCKYQKRKEFIPFGIGKRKCIGESLARLEYVYFLLSIVQKFQIRLVEPVNDTQYEHFIEGTGGIVRAPLNSIFIFEKRIL